jgi:hypothetical protein
MGRAVPVNAPTALTRRSSARAIRTLAQLLRRARNVVLDVTSTLAKGPVTQTSSAPLFDHQRLIDAALRLPGGQGARCVSMEAFISA